MRKTVSILLLLLFAYTTGGYYFAFKILQLQVRSEIKEEMKNSLNESELEIITVPASKMSELRWTRPGKEFVYKNKMFDVVKKQEKNGTTSFFCLNDKKEERLFANLDEYVRKNTTRNNKVKNILAKNISNYFFEEIKTPDSNYKAERLESSYKETYESLYSESHSPPPKRS